MTIRPRIKAFVDAHPDEQDPEELARMFMASVRKVDLLELVVQEIKMDMRRDVRAAEIIYLSSAATPAQPRSLFGVKSALADLVPLLDKPYRIGDGHARTLGQLTVEEHKSRISMLRANINSMQGSIALHERAIALCYAHDVTCLDDLRSEAA